MVEFTAKSGAVITINLAPWADAKRLKSAIEREAAAAGIKIDAEADAATLINAALMVDSSEAVDAALYPCLARCMRGTEKITSNTFNSEEGRQDYYEIVTRCVMENFRPLVEGLLNVLPPSLLAMFQKNKNQNLAPKP